MADGAEHAKVVEAAGVIGLATLLSRILGFARDMVLARLFGAAPAADAFFVAYRIPNLLRELFAEGSMSAAFIPVFSEYLTKRTKRDAWELASAAFTTLLTVRSEEHTSDSHLGISYAVFCLKKKKTHH